VSLDDWLLAFHLISAFALIGALTIFTVMIATLWHSDDPAAVTSFTRLGMAGNVLVVIGSLGTVVFGVWLAISRDAYHVWDGWVIAAIVLWALMAGIGSMSGQAYGKTAETAEQLVASGGARSPELAAALGPSRAFWMHVTALVLVVLILVDMIWKPGA
jgi:cation transport ATPase